MTLSAGDCGHCVAPMFRREVLRQRDRCAASRALGVRRTGNAIPDELCAGLYGGDGASRRVVESGSRNGRALTALTAQHFVVV